MRAALVAAGDHERPLARPAAGSPPPARAVVSHLPAMPAHVELARGDQPVDQRAPADGADEHDVAAAGRRVVGDEPGRTPVTAAMSACRSPTTRTTPAWSPALTTIGAALPAATSGKLPGPGANAT